MKIVIATKNKGKVREIKEMLAGIEFKGMETDLKSAPIPCILCLSDFPEIPPILEDGASFAENALKKARHVSKRLDMIALADDSGLEVDALDKRPGIYSARYAGENATDADNNARLITELNGVPFEKRTARYKCAIAIVAPSGYEDVAEGECCGFITFEPRGNGGFGYDPLFYLPEYQKTMAEIPADEKNRISHRGKALVKLKEKLLRSA